MLGIGIERWAEVVEGSELMLSGMETEWRWSEHLLSVDGGRGTVGS